MSEETTQKRGSAASRFFIFAAICGGAWYFWPQPGFSDAEVDGVKASIREEWGKKKDISVDEVVMIRESDRSKMTGFVRLRISGLNDPVTKSCSATKGDKEYLWQCR